MLRCVVWYKFTDVSEVLIASIVIALMMEAVNTSETSVNFYQTTQHNIPEDSHLHTCRRDNPKSHLLCNILIEFTIPMTVVRLIKICLKVNICHMDFLFRMVCSRGILYCHCISSLL
jgi:hypothetical protein